MGWKYFPNLAKRPHAPAKGRGRRQRQVRRFSDIYFFLFDLAFEGKEVLLYPANRGAIAGDDLVVGETERAHDQLDLVG
jgi:hypothetical protein